MNISYNYCIRNTSHQIPNYIFLPKYFAFGLILVTGSLIYAFKHINSSYQLFNQQLNKCEALLTPMSILTLKECVFEERYKRIEYLHITSTSLTYFGFLFPTQNLLASKALAHCWHSLSQLASEAVTSSGKYHFNSPDQLRRTACCRNRKIKSPPS